MANEGRFSKLNRGMAIFRWRRKSKQEFSSSVNLISQTFIKELTEFLLL